MHVDHEENALCGSYIVLSALDYLYKVLLEIRESENCVEVLKEEIYKVIHDSSLNESTIVMILLQIILMSIVLMICKAPSLGMICLMKMIFLVP